MGKQKLLNQNKAAELSENIDIFLVWLVKGAMKYYQYGLGKLPEIMQEEKDKYYKENDEIGEFLEMCCDTSDPDAKCNGSDLFNSYKEYINNQVYSNITFTNKMKEKGYEKKPMRIDKNSPVVRGYIGIGLN